MLSMYGNILRNKENREGINYFFPFLCVLSALFLSGVGVPYFAPLPLCFAILFLGRKKGHALCLGALISLFLIKGSFGAETLVFIETMLLHFALAHIVSLGITECLLRGFDLGKSLLGLLGLYFLLACAPLAYVQYVNRADGGLEGAIEKQVIEFSRVLKDRDEKYGSSLEEVRGPMKIGLEMLSRPKIIVDLLIKILPSLIYFSLAFVIWFNMLFAIKGSRKFWHGVKGRTKKRYQPGDLYHLSFPDWPVWILIVFLAVFVLEDFVKNPVLQGISYNGLAITSSFFALRGLSIYLKFLDYLKISRFMRLFLLIACMVGGQLIFFYFLFVCIGVADIWAIFSKRMKKKKSRKTN